MALLRVGSLCVLSLPSVCMAIALFFLVSDGVVRIHDCRSRLFIRSAWYSALKNQVSSHDCSMSEQSARLSQFPAVHCSLQCPLKLCCSVIVVVCMSSQLGTVSTSAHRPADAQLSRCFLFFLPAELQCGKLCHWAGCIPRHCCWWQSWLAI